MHGGMTAEGISPLPGHAPLFPCLALSWLAGSQSRQFIFLGIRSYFPIFMAIPVVRSKQTASGRRV